MNSKDVKKLISYFDKSSIREFEFHEGDFDIYLSKNNEYGKKSKKSELPISLPNILANAGSVLNKGNDVATKQEESKVEEGYVVKSPIVGVVYLKPGPDSDVYVKVGDTVSEKTTVCIVEAMKMMNEVQAGKAGTITEILCHDEQVVGVGDPLFRIKE
ncbi:MAG: acetyl-CoA carboxylase biotin carboxyl carrier protein [Lachnospiraceae bacterium]|jgi:acetyl-CoA carboxylase biotin carboxyl carrier protein|nr:acetyl-CoA carboxylase biotin carboxyl carrier protein [Lachnospiraceae bacterium]